MWVDAAESWGMGACRSSGKAPETLAPSLSFSHQKDMLWEKNDDVSVVLVEINVESRGKTVSVNMFCILEVLDFVRIQIHKEV